MYMKTALIPVVAFAAGLAGGGCVHSVGTGKGGLKVCGPAGQIDDFEDNNNQNFVVENRGGYWYTFIDKVGTTVWPEAGEAGGTFTPAEGGYKSKYTAEMKGKIGTGSVVFAGLGINMQDPKAAYDASKYAGVTFWAKKGPNSTGKVRLKIPDGNTDPEGKVCTECFNDFGMDLTLTEEWQRFTLLFRDMKQLEGWGSPRKPHIDASKIYGLQWQVNQQGADYDIFIDNLGFICQG